ncbi:uncharacterized protein EKO05_0003072 [Ascochyta rabiei]|uniref:uncharacterized protein n=1 Tax=Didymella rabiei TaxID=5454 RepID=UPI0022014DA3|nr:uncharacterized protein EKO05_0003072 [Ascochyta rabiei]UPX12527.1 hypothetical protein EKO05_0003072 [Ascochyta rabiei]
MHRYRGRRHISVSKKFVHGVVHFSLKQLRTGDPEAQDHPREVIIDSSTSRLDLDEAFHNSFILRGLSFIQMNERISILTNSHTAAERPCHAILIKVTTDMASVAMVLAMVIAFCIAAGIATDFLAKDAEIGLAVCTGAEGIFALIQGSLVGVDARSMNSKANR